MGDMDINPSTFGSTSSDVVSRFPVAPRRIITIAAVLTGVLLLGAANKVAEKREPSPAVPPTLAEGKPTFQAARHEVKLTEPCPHYLLAGSGRYLLFHAKEANRIDALDVLAGEITHQIPDVPDDALIAAGAEKLLVVLPGRKLVQRYNLRTFRREKLAPLPGSGVARVALMGSAGDGPLLLAGDDAQLIDVRALKPLAFDRPPIGRHDRYGFVGRVSADGKTFTGIPAGIGAVSYERMRVEGDRVSFASFGSTSHAVRWAEPTADGSLFLVPGGVYSAHLTPIPVEELKDSRISATIDPRYFTAARFAKNETGDEVVQLLICTTADHRVVHVETGFEELALQGNTNSRMSITNRLLHDAQSHVHYIPWAGVIATIGYDDVTVTLRKFDLVAALKKSGRDYLFVDSVPPVRIRPGESLSYRISVQAARRGIKFKLETGPEGMTVSKSGEVKWKVPVDVTADTFVAAVSIRDRAGNEILHAFELAVVKDDQRVGSATTRSAELRQRPQRSSIEPRHPLALALLVGLAEALGPTGFRTVAAGKCP
jgi:hypothetical protein